MQTIKMAKCGMCDDLHPIEQLEPAFRMPHALMQAMANGVLQVKELREIKHHPAACWLSKEYAIYEADVANNKPQFFVRSVIPMPFVDGGNKFHIGVWVKLDIDSFYTIVETWRGDGPTPPDTVEVLGTVANHVPHYPEVMDSSVLVKFAGYDKVPELQLGNPESDLTRLQQAGITTEFIQMLLSEGTFKRGAVTEVPVH